MVKQIGRTEEEHAALGRALDECRFADLTVDPGYIVMLLDQVGAEFESRLVYPDLPALWQITDVHYSMQHRHFHIRMVSPEFEGVVAGLPIPIFGTATSIEIIERTSEPILAETAEVDSDG